MREIKFRAWTDRSKTMTNPYFWLNDENLIGQSMIGSPSHVMQYTGLKDINGTEIYEGDIVHWGHVKGAGECVPRKAVVEIAPDIQFRTFNLGKNNHTFKFGRFIYTNTSKALEIIGNIHENPDLLE